eukprot:743251_1
MSYEISILEDKRIIHHTQQPKPNQQFTDSNSQIRMYWYSFPDYVYEGHVPQIHWANIKNLISHKTIKPKNEEKNTDYYGYNYHKYGWSSRWLNNIYHKSHKEQKNSEEEHNNIKR